MGFDPFLYLALALGVAAGRGLPHPPGAWVPRATIATIVVLVGLLGASLSGVGGTALLVAVPVSLADAALILGLTTGIYWGLVRPHGPVARAAVPAPFRIGRFSLSLGLLAALLAGYVLGRAVPFAYANGISFALYVLLALVGFGLQLTARSLGRLWLPLTSAVAGALVAGVVFSALFAVPLPVSLATSLAFGWYTLAGPLVAARAGALLGLIAFLTNFLRENLTMLTAPAVGGRLKGPGLTALGGATAMDTTLYFVVHYGEEDAASLALASGLILTVAASLVLPLVLAL